jgi:hypothetical protein
VSAEPGGRTTALPPQLREPEFRFIPLVRGEKTARVKGQAWQEGQPYSPDLDEYLADLGDIGIRLGPSPLVVLDLDSVLEYVFSGNEAHTRIAYGGAELWSWLQERGLELPPTFTVTSAGRSDGSHVTGLHMYFRQNPQCPLSLIRDPVAHVQVKTSGIVRFTDRSYVAEGYDLPIAEMPLNVALALQESTRARRDKGGGGNGSGPYTDSEVDGLLDSGIPDVESQDVELARLVWALVLRGEGDRVIRLVWDQVVAKSPQFNPDWPWSEDDFRRHLGGARAKLGKPSAPTPRQYEIAQKLTDGSADDADRADLVKAGQAEAARLLPQEIGRALARRMAADALGAEDSAAGEPVTITRGADLKVIIPEYLADGWIPRRGVGIAYGAKDQYKSTVMGVDLGGSVANGLPWLGQETRRSRVLSLVGEGDYLAGVQKAAWLAAHPGTSDDGWDFITQTFAVTPARLSELLNVIDGEGYGLIILDTLADYLSGDDSSNPDASAFIRAMKALAARAGGFVLAVAHSGHAGTHIRGASRWPQGIDSVIKVDSYTVTCEHQKQGPAPKPRTFGIGTVPLPGTSWSGLYVREPNLADMIEIAKLAWPSVIDRGRQMWLDGEASLTVIAEKLASEPGVTMKAGSIRNRLGPAKKENPDAWKRSDA